MLPSVCLLVADSRYSREGDEEFTHSLETALVIINSALFKLVAYLEIELSSNSGIWVSAGCARVARPTPTAAQRQARGVPSLPQAAVLQFRPFGGSDALREHVAPVVRQINHPSHSQSYFLAEIPGTQSIIALVLRVTKHS